MRSSKWIVLEGSSTDGEEKIVVHSGQLVSLRHLPECGLPAFWQTQRLMIVNRVMVSTALVAGSPDRMPVAERAASAVPFTECVQWASRRIYDLT